MTDMDDYFGVCPECHKTDGYLMPSGPKRRRSWPRARRAKTAAASSSSSGGSASTISYSCAGTTRTRLFLRRNNTDPLVLLPWRIWARLLEAIGERHGR
jgi:hypothetical protein